MRREARRLRRRSDVAPTRTVRLRPCLDAERLNVGYNGWARTAAPTLTGRDFERNVMRMPPDNARLKVSAGRGRGIQHPGMWTGLGRCALAVILVTAALSGAAQAKQKQAMPAPMSAGAAPAPNVDKCGHPIVLDNVGSPYTDPVCTALSDTLQPPLYIPDPECNRGVEPYDSRCYMERLLTVITASPGPPPLARPLPYPVK
jgi:hypothetical protein